MSQTSDILKQFFENTDLTLKQAQAIVAEGLEGADYGEFYQEQREQEVIAKDKGIYTNVSLGSSESGFGFRVGQRERVGYSFSDIFNEASLRKAVGEARQVLDADVTPVSEVASFGRAQEQFYTPENPMNGMTAEEKIAKIDEIEAYIKGLDPRITNVSLGYSSTSQTVHIITPDGQSMADIRPKTTLSIKVQLTNENGETETGMALLGGLVGCEHVFDPANYQASAKQALEQADMLLTAEEAPAGVMDVVLSPGWSGVLLHEAVGHGLEGDFNRKDISAYSGKIGQKVAASEVTVVDQGDMPGERGSLHFDDEGTPTQRNVLIENGVLRGYMQDRQNAQLTGSQLTGNGRRESYRHLPMPRMTNTYFDNGKHDPAEIIASVDDGIYITNMAGGQVDITSGKFNMNATIAFRIRAGKICEPLKGVTLVGDGLTVIQSITMVGNDLAIEKAAGVCGKDGQNVTVSVGQPTVRVANMTVGGSKM